MTDAKQNANLSNFALLGCLRERPTACFSYISLRPKKKRVCLSFPRTLALKIAVFPHYFFFLTFFQIPFFFHGMIGNFHRYFVAFFVLNGFLVHKIQLVYQKFLQQIELHCLMGEAAMNASKTRTASTRISSFS